MQRQTLLGVISIAAVIVAACGKKEEPPKAPVPAVSVAPAETPKTTAPDFGGTTKVSREVEAVGSTLELATLSALQSAVAQVNGVKVASQLQSLRTGLEVSSDGQKVASTNVEAFAQKMVAGSQGLVLSYEVIKQEEVDKVDEETIAKVRASDGGFSYSASSSSEGSASANANVDGSYRGGDASARYSASASKSAEYKEKSSVDAKKGPSSYSSDVTTRKIRSYWKVRIKADITQYKAPDEGGRPKIVVALPKTLSAKYSVGDAAVSSAEVAQAVRGRLSDIMTQTKRFIVLDREFGEDMQAEIDKINSGSVRAQDAARIGQQMATDLILIPTIERFEYPKQVRKLKMSDRELVSYSGGGRITLRLLNATTGEVVMSNSFEHQLASADPSTMPRVVDGSGMAAEMMDQLAGKIGTAIVTEIFPVSVVSLNGDQVVLSQGGESLQAGQVWQAVYLGEELKDPQTGRSLGRNESPAGTVRIDRVSTQTSYGTLEGSTNLPSGKPFVSGSIQLRKQVNVTPTKPDVVAKSASSADTSKGQTGEKNIASRKSSKSSAGSTPDAPVSTAPAEVKKDEKW